MLTARAAVGPGPDRKYIAMSDNDGSVILSNEKAQAIAEDCRMASTLLKGMSDTVEFEDTADDLPGRLNPDAIQKILNGVASH
jgi:hypothetical protein